MPPRAAPGDREKIEAALAPAHRVGLSSLCRTLGVPREKWQEVASLQWAFETAAVLRLASRLREEDGNGVSSSRAALERAGRVLEVAPDTVATRVRRLDDVCS